ncbi:MAG: glycosyltransferase family 4 protein [Oscillospiraceae bacterium]|nr:glycosyltransferase family 4 protein [Oscillospiraceae bacterium]
MKILLVNSYYYPNSNGGAEIVCRKLAEKLAEKGYSVDVLTIDDHFHKEKINGVNVTYLSTFIGRNRKDTKIFAVPFVKIFRIFSIFDYFRIRKIIGKNYDLIHTHAIEDFSPVIWCAAKSCNIPVVHTMHDKYLLCPRLFKLRKNLKVCHSPNIICLIRQKLFFHLAKSINTFVSPSKSLADSMHIKSIVIPNGVDMKRNNSERTEYSNQTFRFLYVGNLYQHKGIPILLSAFEKISGDIELHIVGDGPLRNKVEQAMENDTRIHFYGWLDNEQVMEHMRKCDCLVHPTLWTETSSMNVMEAFSCNLPVIVSDIGAIPEIVEDGTTGYLFTPGNVQELHEKMMKIMEENEKSRIEKNIMFLKEKFHIDEQVSQYEAVYKGILNNLNH